MFFGCLRLLPVLLLALPEDLEADERPFEAGDEEPRLPLLDVGLLLDFELPERELPDLEEPALRELLLLFFTVFDAIMGVFIVRSNA